MKCPHSAITLSCRHLGLTGADAGLWALTAWDITPSPDPDPARLPTISPQEVGRGSETLPQEMLSGGLRPPGPPPRQSLLRSPRHRPGLTFLPALSSFPSVSWRRDGRIGARMQDLCSARGHRALWTPASLSALRVGGKDSRGRAQTSCSVQDTLIAPRASQGFQCQGLQAGEVTLRPAILPPEESSLGTTFPGSGRWSHSSSRFLGDGNMTRPPCPSVCLPVPPPSLCPPPRLPVPLSVVISHFSLDRARVPQRSSLFISLLPLGPGGPAFPGAPWAPGAPANPKDTGVTG